MATIKDVAALAGVSISTVSIVLNGKAEERKVAPKTYKKVLDAINTLKYEPNMTARRLRSSESNKPTIALYWPLDYRTTYLSIILMGIKNEMKKLNYDCDIVVCTYENDMLSNEFNLSIKNKFSAAIIGATSAKDMEFLESLESQIPIVLFNRHSDKYSTVCNNDDVSAYKAAKLFAAKGHKRVSIFSAESSHLAMTIRSKSFIKACKELDIVIDKNFILEAENSYEGGALAARRFVNLENRPKALFCDSDFLALGASYIFNKENIKIPKDLEIIAIGLSHANTTEYATPPITVVYTPTEEMAADCMNLIYNALKNNTKDPIHRLHEPKLLLRDSCRP